MSFQHILPSYHMHFVIVSYGYIKMIDLVFKKNRKIIITGI